MKSLKSELQKLSEWLNAERPEFPWSAVQGFSSYWRDRKILYPVAAIRTKAQCSCDGGDLEDIEYDKAGKPYIMCSRTGHIRFLEKEELRYWNFSGEVLACFLSGLLECKGLPQELIPAKLWKLGQTAHHLGGQLRDVYFALRMTSDADSIYEKLPKGSRVMLIVGSSSCRPSAHFPSDKIFCIANILKLETTGLAFNRERMDSMLGGIPKTEKKKPDAGARGKNIEALQKFLEEELHSAWSFYCNRNDKDSGPQKYPRLTLETLAAGIGSTKGTVSKIFNERKNGKPRYPLLKVLWDSLETEDGVMVYGRSHFRQPQRKN